MSLSSWAVDSLKSGRTAQKAGLRFLLRCTTRVRMAEPALHILIVDANRIRASIIEEGLREAGHTRVTVLDDMNRLVRRVVEIDPDVIVIDLENPSRDVLEHMFQISRAAKRPVAMFVDRADRTSIEAAIEAGVSAYVVDGLRKERIKPILDTAVSRFRAFDRLRRDLDQARNELAERKTVERAKGILMRTRGLSEPDAYALLRTAAMRQSRRIVEIAESLITAAGLLGEEKP
jgi:two-component system, response regulator / RNA-binding antiterminator